MSDKIHCLFQRKMYIKFNLKKNAPVYYFDDTHCVVEAIKS